MQIEAYSDAREKRIKIAFSLDNPTSDVQVDNWGGEIRELFDQVETLLLQIATRQEQLAQVEVLDDPEFQRQREREMDIYLGRDAYSQSIRANQEKAARKKAAEAGPQPRRKTFAELQQEQREETDRLFGRTP